jgi:transglutaminase-like putative cysteine protease
MLWELHPSSLVCFYSSDMRLRIAHSMVYRYEPPATGAIQVLRLTPRNFDGQYVVRWRIDVTPDARLAAREDAFGNITHVFTADGPLAELKVEIDGQVETQSTEGVVRGTVERFTPSLFLRDTPLTQANLAMREFAEELRAKSGGGVLAALHALLDQLHEEIERDIDPAQVATTAEQAFTAKYGVAQDVAHIFIGAAHSLSIPARYVGGYFCDPDVSRDLANLHGWAEAYVPDLGWVSFDPTNGLCPTDAHIRVAVGLDSLGAAPVRGTRYGIGTESAAVTIKVGQ